MIIESQQPRVGSQGRSIGRQHNIVDKDYFRAMKTQLTVEKHFSKKRLNSAAIKSQSKFKSRTQLIMDEFKNPELPSHKLYVIDKVARIRAKEGRFGVDHSEILNFEFELANKNRSDHMNQLVYKSTKYTDSDFDLPNGVNDKENFQLLSSTALFHRLTQKELKDQQRTQEQDGDQKNQTSNKSLTQSQREGLSFNEWVKRKDAEKRMRQKLINESKNEIRQDLYNLAQEEQQEQEFKVKFMEDWLMQKKLNEAQKIAQLQDMQERETIEKQMREQENFKSYKDWLKKNMIREKQQKYMLLQARKELVERQREDEMKKSIEAQIEYKQWQNEKKRQEVEFRKKQDEVDISSGGGSQLYSPLRSRPTKK